MKKEKKLSAETIFLKAVDFLHQNMEMDLVIVIKSIYNLRQVLIKFSSYSLLLSLTVGFLLGFLSPLFIKSANLTILTILIALFLLCFVLFEQNQLEKEIKNAEDGVIKAIESHISNIGKH